MVEYLTKEEIQGRHTALAQALDEKDSYFLREGFIERTLLTIPKEATVVEFGCGRGALTSRLLALGFSKVHAVDLDWYGAPEAFRSAITFHAADLSRDTLPLPSASAGVVIAAATLEHLENPFYCVREAARLLAPGGLFLFSIPHAASLHARMQFLFEGEVRGYHAGNNHLVIFTPSLIQKTIEKYFTPRAIYYSQGWVPFWGRKVHLPRRHFLNKWFGTKAYFEMVRH